MSILVTKDGVFVTVCGIRREVVDTEERLGGVRLHYKAMCGLPAGCVDVSDSAMMKRNEGSGLSVEDVLQKEKNDE